MDLEKYINRLVELGMTSDEAKNFIEEIRKDNTPCSWSIRIEYITGDSFGSHPATETLDLPWHNIDIVKENIKRLEEHVEFYEKTRQFWGGPKEWDKLQQETLKSKPWAVENQGQVNKYSIYLLKDDGTKFQVSVGWVGYFEHSQNFLIHANIL